MTSLALTETDLILCLLEVWYDTTWAYYMSANGDHVANRIDKCNNTTSVSFSKNVVGKSFQEKLHMLEENLRQVETRMKARDFENICDTMVAHDDDDDYPWNNTLEITKFLLQETLTREEVDELTLPVVFQVLYYQLCDYLLKHPQAMKLVIAPTKNNQDTYDVCRHKFCMLLSDETSIIQDGLSCLVKKIRLPKSPKSPKSFRFPTIELSSDDDDDDDELC